MRILQKQSSRITINVVSLAVLTIGAVLPQPSAASEAVDPLECGKACLAKKDYKRAEADLKKAVQDSPRNCEGHLLLGQVYCKKKEYELAKKQLRLSIRYGKGNDNAKKANDELLQLPQEVVAPKMGAETREIASSLNTPATEGAANKPRIIDFYATWCSPCQQLHLALEKAKTEYGDKISFQRVNVDDSSNQKLIDQYEVSPIPTVIFLNAQGEVVSFTVGYSGETAISNGIKRILPPT